MRCIIKNVPPQTFGIAGNRGVGFPVTDYCAVIAQPIIEDANCYLIKEDGLLDILTEGENQINVTCTAPSVNEPCYLIPQPPGNTSDWVVDQQSRDFILINCQ